MKPVGRPIEKPKLAIILPLHFARRYKDESKESANADLPVVHWTPEGKVRNPGSDDIMDGLVINVHVYHGSDGYRSHIVNVEWRSVYAIDLQKAKRLSYYARRTERRFRIIRERKGEQLAPTTVLEDVQEAMLALGVDTVIQHETDGASGWSYDDDSYNLTAPNGPKLRRFLEELDLACGARAA